MSNRLFDWIVNDPAVKRAIEEKRASAPGHVWTAEEIDVLVASEADTNLDTRDTEFFARLVAHFNRPTSE